MDDNAIKTSHHFNLFIFCGSTPLCKDIPGDVSFIVHRGLYLYVSSIFKSYVYILRISNDIAIKTLPYFNLVVFLWLHATFNDIPGDVSFINHRGPYLYVFHIFKSYVYIFSSSNDNAIKTSTHLSFLVSRHFIKTHQVTLVLLFIEDHTCTFLIFLNQMFSYCFYHLKFIFCRYRFIRVCKDLLLHNAGIYNDLILPIFI